MIKNIKFIFVYFFLLSLVWLLNEFFLRQVIDNSFSAVTADIIKECVVKIIVWFVPALLFAKKYSSHMYVRYSDLFRVSPKNDFKVFLPVFLLLSFYILLFKFRSSGGIHISQNFIPYIPVFFCVGLAEETVFRGVLLNSSLDDQNQDFQWKPVILNALMFLAVHFPRWLKEGVFLSNFLSGGFLSILLLSTVFSYSFVKSKNIAVPVLLHAWWDFFLFILS